MSKSIFCGLLAIFLCQSVLAQPSPPGPHQATRQAPAPGQVSGEITLGVPNVKPVIGQGSRLSETGYCDIIAVTRRFWGGAQARTFSTFRVSECTPQSISRLTAASVRAQMATLGLDKADITVGGPYYYMMDINNSQVENSFLSIGKLRFSEVAFSQFGFWDAIRNPQVALRWFNQKTSYNPTSTAEDVNYVWFSGSRVFMIVGADGTRYVMTAIAHPIMTGVQGISLENLGEFLNLPEGWYFESRVLGRVLSMNSAVLSNNYQFDRLVDEYSNLYMQIPFVEGLFEAPNTILEPPSER